MSILLQFGGKYSSKGVHLQFVHTTPSEKFIEREIYPTGAIGPKVREYYLKDSESCGDTTDGVFVPGGKFYPRIWTAPRKPRGMFGCWVVFKYNGRDQVPDLSVPIHVFKLPKDAKPMTNEETINIWKS